MDAQPRQLHIFFLPQMADDIIIPTVELAILFAKHGVKSTVISTPLNSPFIAERVKEHHIPITGSDVSIQIVKFPSTKAGLPENCENLKQITSPEMAINFKKAHILLQQPVEELLQKFRPSYLVTDTVFTWATESARKFEIPRLIFYATGFFPLCALDSVFRYQPHGNVTSDLDPFFLPGLPDEIKLTKLQLPNFIRETTKNEIGKILDHAIQVETKSYGIIVNSFNELEPAYSDHYRKIMGRKAWQIGPISLLNRKIGNEVENLNTLSIVEDGCLKWLDSKKQNSVLYVNFGSVFRFSDEELTEMAMGLEESRKNFIWVVNMNNEDEEIKEKWVLEEFEVKIKDKGLIIRDKSNQIKSFKVLKHESVGGFMTNCEWSSAMESIIAGVPMVTWPFCAEQFFNERFITDVLGIGVGVGAKEWRRWVDERRLAAEIEAVGAAVRRVMAVEGEGEVMRRRVKVFGEMAERAVEEGGSSFCGLNVLLEELRMNCSRNEIYSINAC